MKRGEQSSRARRKEHCPGRRGGRGRVVEGDKEKETSFNHCNRF